MGEVPFTVSHVAAAVPLFRTRLVASALAIGCMAPDLEYFMTFDASGGFGHTIPGLFLFDLPASLLIFWMFHTYAKEPLYSWLPANVRKRIRLGPSAMSIQNFSRFLLVALSIFIGSVTHLLWDSLTHRNMWPYRHWPFLRHIVHLPVFGGLEFLRVIQHLSTIGGALVLLLWFQVWYRNTVPDQPGSAPGMPRSSRTILIPMVLIALFAAAAHAFVGAGTPDNRNTDKIFLIYFVTTSMAVFWLEIVAYGVYRRRLQSRVPTHCQG